MTEKPLNIDDLSEKISQDLQKSIMRLVETKAAKNENLIIRDSKVELKQFLQKNFFF